MSMGREGDRQGDLIVTWAELPRSPGHVFYDRLQEVLIAGGFDGFVETACQPYYAPKMGTPSLPPGRYFRMHMIGYFEGIASERGIVWRCSDSMSLRDFLRLESREKIPDHSWLSKTRGRLPHEVHETVFGWVLKLVAEQGLVKGKRIGVDASTMEANAALRTIVRRDDGRTYREMLQQMAKESGIETPTADDLVRIDRARKGKKLSNEEWTSKTDPEAKIARMKDGRTHSRLQARACGRSRHRRHRRGDAAPCRSRRHNDDRWHAGGGAEQHGPGQRRADKARAERTGHRQRLSLARPLEGPRRRGVEDAHCRTQAAGLFTLARRRQGAGGGLCQPHPSRFGGRQAGNAAAGGNRRAVLRP